MSAFEILLLALVTAHLLADFILQSDEEVKAKADISSRALVLHALKTAGLAWFLAGFPHVWQIPLLIGLSHMVIDWLKAKGLQRRLQHQETRGTAPVANWDAFLLDQTLHVAALLAISCYLVQTQTLGTTGDWWLNHLGLFWPRCLVLAAGATLVVHVGGVVIGMIVAPLLRELAPTIQPTSLEPLPTRGLANGGKVIGQLERALIFLLTFLGQPAGVGFLIAAKSIFRFGELRDANQRKEAEYIIIGTFLSFGWALLWTEITRRALHALS